ncbi:MAG TPA: hypothetical protein VFE10_01355 [Phenylobacterium sp.]|jgi:nucleotide-binding universal stress UspA family protein|nr:hypothetical protein [Phenylobacterium sp.]
MSLAQARSTAVQPLPGGARYATLLVHAEPGLQSSQRVEVAGRLARELGAHLIGVCAETLSPFMVSDPALGYVSDQRVVKLMEVLDQDLVAAETAFARDAGGADIQCRRLRDFPANALARTARAADLIVVSPKTGAPSALEADPGEVIMRSGKPVLVVPPHAHRLRLDTIVVAWKDTREARHAVAAALPFLLRAEEVVVLSICDDNHAEECLAQVEDVVAGLKRQGVRASAKVRPSKDGVINELMRTLSDVDADLVVAGAYGHTRLQELVFGGVTEHFLRKPACFALMAH